MKDCSRHRANVLSIEEISPPHQAPPTEQLHSVFLHVRGYLILSAARDNGRMFSHLQYLTTDAVFTEAARSKIIPRVIL